MATDSPDPRSLGPMRELLIAAGAAVVLVSVVGIHFWQHAQTKLHSAQLAAVSRTNIPANVPTVVPAPPSGTLAVTSEPAGARLEKINGPVPAQAWTVPELNMAMIWIPSGSFVMGSATGETNEMPAHRVTVTKGFWISPKEVTQAEWLHVMDNFVSDASGFNRPEFDGTNLPIEKASWFDCIEFCARLTERERQACRLSDDLEFRLPTEAEWEYACRAGTCSEFCFGNDLDTTMANFDGRHPVGNRPPGDYRKATMPGGSFKPNPWGLFDMHGNVFEWCADWYGDYADADQLDPRGPKDGGTRVARGGSWYDYGTSCRSAFRSVLNPNDRYNDVGMRLVLGAPLGDSDHSKNTLKDLK